MKTKAKKQKPMRPDSKAMLAPVSFWVRGLDLRLPSNEMFEVVLAGLEKEQHQALGYALALIDTHIHVDLKKTKNAA